MYAWLYDFTSLKLPSRSWVNIRLVLLGLSWHLKVTKSTPGLERYLRDPGCHQNTMRDSENVNVWDTAFDCNPRSGIHQNLRTGCRIGKEKRLQANDVSLGRRILVKRSKNAGSGPPLSNSKYFCENCQSEFDFYLLTCW